MPFFNRGDVSLYYEIHGEGFPLLLFAPGGMRSAIPFWYRGSWNPIESLKDKFQVIAMDQRNAGQSTAPIKAGDGWSVYTEDHIALLDHLGVERCHLLGGCIGGPYCFGVIEAAPDRVASAVLQQSIGNDGQNAAVFDELFEGWAREVKPKHPDVPDAVWAKFKQNMFGAEFVYNVSREFVANCTTPLLVLMGRDDFHPEVTSRDIADLAPNAELVERWQDAEVAPRTPGLVAEFLAKYTP